MAAQRREVQAHVAQHTKCIGEAVARIPFGQQCDDVHVAFVAKLLFEIRPDAGDVSAIVLREIDVLERRVDLHERAAYPPVERF